MRHLSHGQPYSDEAYNEHRDKNEDEVCRLNGYGVGIDDESPFALTELDKTESLLCPAEQ